MRGCGLVDGAGEGSGGVEFVEVRMGFFRRWMGLMGVEIDGKASTNFDGSVLGMELDGVEIGVEEVWQGASHEVLR
jgi:hypothetical protein